MDGMAFIGSRFIFSGMIEIDQTTSAEFSARKIDRSASFSIIDMAAWSWRKRAWQAEHYC
ncbi:MAG: hypothetical protein AAB325_09485 [Pseudomonadota bacterium]